VTGLRAITSFTGPYRFLSNFYPRLLTIDSVHYATAEHAFQAAKAVFPEDRTRIIQASTPGIAKRIGKSIQLRHGWEDVKIDVLKNILRAKFVKYAPMSTMINPLAKQLIDTYPADLVEGNTWHDNEWGNCTCPRCSNKAGQNLLGRLLMKVRLEIRG
jgi:ribA/ribD-fused uncharacterized protein